MQETEQSDAKRAADTYEETDIFLWANNLVQYKEELNFELFFISKRYVPFKTKLSSKLRKQLEPIFIDGILEYVLGGMDKGLVVRGFEEAEKEEGVLQRTQISKVEKAREVINWLTHQEHELEVFNDQEHDFSRMKGIIAKITHKEMKKPFYIAKALPRSNVMSSREGWMLRNGSFVEFDADATLRIPTDNQLLILDQDIYVFSQPKLKQLFKYDAKLALIAEKKVEEIQKLFKLRFPADTNMQTLVNDKPGVVKKLQKINPHAVTMDKMLEQAEDMEIELSLDEDGAIIIMDGRDLGKFVNLLNDDYIESPMTGQKYEIISKKEVKPDSEEAQS